MSHTLKSLFRGNKKRSQESNDQYVTSNNQNITIYKCIIERMCKQIQILDEMATTGEYDLLHCIHCLNNSFKQMHYDLFGTYDMITKEAKAFILPEGLFDSKISIINLKN